MNKKLCTLWIVLVLVVEMFTQGTRVEAGVEKEKNILVSNADFIFMLVVELEAQLVDNMGSQLVEIHARIDRRKKRMRSFKLVMDGATIRLGRSIREMESVYGPVDLASLRMFRVQGEFSNTGEPVRYRVEFGFRERYRDFVYALPFQHALPQCFIEISERHPQHLGCYEYGADGRIVTRQFAFK